MSDIEDSLDDSLSEDEDDSLPDLDLKLLPLSLVGQPRIHIAARIALYIIGGILMALGLSEIAGIVVEAMMQKSDLKATFFIIPALTIFHLVTAGITLIISVARAQKDSVHQWKIAHWCMAGVSIVFLLIIIATTLGVITLSILSSAAIVQIITALIYTFCCNLKLRRNIG